MLCISFLLAIYAATACFSQEPDTLSTFALGGMTLVIAAVNVCAWTQLAARAQALYGLRLL